MRGCPLSALGALLALLVVVAGCGTADANLSTVEPDLPRAAGPTGSILFVSEGNVMVWRDGEIDQLTDDEIARSPSWSAAGDRFAYIRMSDGFSDLIVA